MPVHFANGLFDQPWLVAVFIIVGLISNWLMKRRQEQEVARRPEGERPAAPEKPEEEFDLEAAMRRLLGELPSSQSAPPPVIPGAQRPPPLADSRQADAGELRSGQSWQEEAEEGWAEDGEQLRPAPPPLRPPVFSQSAVGVTVPTEAQAQAARRFAQLNEAGQHPATVVHGGDSRLRAGARAAYWRNPRNARQAFVASLVFGPPKGLEP